jgi:hypothetical protein
MFDELVNELTRLHVVNICIGALRYCRSAVSAAKADGCACVHSVQKGLNEQCGLQLDAMAPSMVHT